MLIQHVMEMLGDRMLLMKAETGSWVKLIHTITEQNVGGRCSRKWWRCCPI